MDEQKYKELLDTIRESKQDVQKELAASMAELKRDVTAVQEKTSQELASKISKSSCQFRRKGNEIQFNFNSSIEDTIKSAKEELKHLKPTEKGEQESLKKARASLDEGMTALEKHQKHIKVANRSDYSWSTVQHYDAHPLASDSDDKKRLEKAEKEAERAANKRRKGGNASTRRHRSWSEGSPQGRREPVTATTSSGLGQAPQNQPRPRVVGPCYCSTAWGHLAANCPAKEKVVYPFGQPVVSEADVNNSVFEVVAVNDVHDVQSHCMPLVSEGVKGTESASLGVKSLSEICVDVLKKGVTGSDCIQTADYELDTVEVAPGRRGDQTSQWEQEA